MHRKTLEIEPPVHLITHSPQSCCEKCGLAIRTGEFFNYTAFEDAWHKLKNNCQKAENN